MFFLAIGHGPVSPGGKDETAAAILQTDRGPALIDDRDTATFLAGLKPLVGAVLDDAVLEEWLQEPLSGRLVWEIGGSRVPVAPILRSELGSRFAFDPAPQPAPGAADC